MDNNTIQNQETLVHHLENEYGYDTTQGGDILFIPYSTKDKWCKKYPIAMPSYVMNEVGDIIVNVVALSVAATTEERYGTKNTTGRGVRKQKVLRGPNALCGHSNLPNAERDELHIAIYDYITWLRDTLIEADANPSDTQKKKTKKRKKAVVSTDNDDNNVVGDEANDDDNVCGEMKASIEEGNADEENVNDSAKKKKTKQTTTWLTASREVGVNISKLTTVMNAFVATFPVV